MYHTDGAEIRISDGGKTVKRKKQKLWVSIILGFAALYLMTMGTATWLVEKKFENEYLNHYKSRMGILQSAADDLGKQAEGNSVSREEWIALCEETFTGIPLGLAKDKQIHLSEAVYDEEGKLLFAGDNTAVSYPVWDSPAPYRETEGLFWNLSDYLKEEELMQAAKYAWLSMEKQLQDMQYPYEYRFLFQVQPDTRTLCGILVQKVTWEKYLHVRLDEITRTSYGYNDYNQTGSEIVWEWKNEAVSEESLSDCELEEANLSFPYLVYGYDAWLRWEKSAYLHDFDGELQMKDGNTPIEAMDVLYQPDENGIWKDAPFQARIKCSVPLYFDGVYADDAHWNLVLVMDSHPWRAAMGYMKYVYLACFVLMLACMTVIICMTNKTYRQRAAIEEMRRDFTNAIAHELKTPLGIIRGFAENLQEHTREDKRDYYLAQIIGQTEEMDRMVAEMISVSKMDSEHLVLQKEPVSISELFREQMERFGPIAEEKHLQVLYDCEEDFTLEGDRDYLAKAVWNLLSNAVTYNIPDGAVRIRTKAEGFCVENTGASLTEEQLTHAFDMFYSSDRSRSFRDKHMGIGLFLTKKILEIHKLEITLENTKDGVRAVIRRKK